MSFRKYEALNDPYVDPETGVLLNLLNIKDAATLEEAETDYAAIRTYEMRRDGLAGDFDLAHLQAIHKYLFQDVYEWAGEIRRINIAKDKSKFANFDFIEGQAEELFTKLRNESYLQGANSADFSDRAAYYLSEVNAIHPFREGNGRVQREFINLLAAPLGLLVNWENAPPEKLLESTKSSFFGRMEPLTTLIKSNLSQIKPKI